MADPVTLTAISIGASVASAGVGAMGSLAAGQSKADVYNYQSGMALRNKEIAKNNADYARWAGELDAQKSGMKTAFVLGKQKAGQGASGLDMNFGTAVKVRESTQDIGWHDQQVIRSDAARKAYAYENEAASQEAQSKVYSRAAEDSKTAGAIGAATSILGGISSVSSKWMQASNLGVFGSGGSRDTRSIDEILYG